MHHHRMQTSVPVTSAGHCPSDWFASFRFNSPAAWQVRAMGNRLKINAVVDADGIARLEQVLDKYVEILRLMQ
jgi:hypothetical protein